MSSPPEQSESSRPSASSAPSERATPPERSGPSERSTPPGPLAGIRVLDLSRVISGPSCGRALVELGAEVIKVEPPEGDLTRRAKPRVGGIPAYFTQLNCGKRCISLDLAKPAARDVFLRLAEVSDVVIENFRPGVVERLGVGYAEVSRRNPKIVYCSITGYGQSGPASSRRAYAPVIHGEMGTIEWTARKLQSEPRPETLSHADHYAGMQGTVGILAALFARQQTGRGQHIDVSMAETMLATNEWTAVELAGGAEGLTQVFGSYECPVFVLADGSRAVVSGNPTANFPRWVEVMERPDLLTDPRFATPDDRQKNKHALNDVLRAWARDIPSFAEFERRLAEVEIATGAVNAVADVARSPWMQARGGLVDIRSGGEAMQVPRSPFRLSDAHVGMQGEPAQQGQHNDQVLRTLLGLNDTEIEALRGAGALCERPSKRS